MTAMTYEICGEARWNDLAVKLRQYAADANARQLLDPQSEFTMEYLEKEYKHFLLNCIRAFLPKINARFVGMIGYSIFYLDAVGTLYTRVSTYGACLRRVNRETFPSSFVEPLLYLIDQTE